MSKTLNISQSQFSGFPKGLSHTYLTVASQSQFAWGAQSIIDFKTKGLKVHELVLAFNTGACSGVTANGSTLPVLNSAFSWFSKLELLINNIVVDTINPDFNFLLNQMYNQDEDKLLLSLAAGNYLSVPNRYALTNTNNSNWYVNIRCLFNQNHLALLSQGHELQIRVSMQPQSNVLNVGALTGTPVIPINSVQLLARVTQLPTNLSNQLLLELSKSPRDNLFLATRSMPITIQSGVSNFTATLTGIVGSVHSIYFTVRMASGLTGASQTSYVAIKDFFINDAGGSNIVGGSVIPSTFNLLIQQKNWALSTFPAEGFTGVNNSYVYMYSFSVDPSSSIKNSSHYTTKTFTGNETLNINFNNSLSGTHQIDIYALVESSIRQSANSIQLIAL